MKYKIQKLGSNCEHTLFIEVELKLKLIGQLLATSIQVLNPKMHLHGLQTLNKPLSRSFKSQVGSVLKKLSLILTRPWFRMNSHMCNKFTKK